MIIDQTKSYSHKDHLSKIENFNRMAVALSTNGTFIPGYCSYDRSYWLFPVLVPNRELFKKFCEAQGVFCYMKATQICPIEMPEDKLQLGLKPAENVKKAFNHMVFLPVNFSIPKKEMDVMIKRTLGILYRYQLLAEFMTKAQNKPFNFKI